MDEEALANVVPPSLADMLPEEGSFKVRNLERWEQAAAVEYSKMLNWQPLAACRGHLWEMYASSEEAQKRIVKKYCMECPVRVDCLSLALVTRERFGVWGATTTARRAMLKELGKKHPRARLDWNDEVAASMRDMAEQVVGVRVPKKLKVKSV